MVLISSCSDGLFWKKRVEVDDFVRKDVLGLVGDGGFLFKYSDEDCQVSVNVGRNQLRLQNDSHTQYVNLVFLTLPKVEGEGSSVDVCYKVGNDEIRYSSKMIAVKMKEGKVWLWDDEKNVGVIAPVIW